MKEEIQKLLKATPFVPFAVEVSGDLSYSLVHPDHVNAVGRQLVIIDDNGYADLVPFSHIRRIQYKVQD